MLGEKIKILRKEHDMTQTDLAKKLGIKQPSLNAWEKNKKNPTIPMLKKLSEIFAISIDTLLFDQKDVEILTIKDKALLTKFKEIDKLTENEKEIIINMINTLAQKKQIA
jgi:transcriptional regulator with XRE-family HTH domain